MICAPNGHTGTNVPLCAIFLDGEPINSRDSVPKTRLLSRVLGGADPESVREILLVHLDVGLSPSLRRCLQTHYELLADLTLVRCTRVTHWIDLLQDCALPSLANLVLVHNEYNPAALACALAARQDVGLPDINVELSRFAFNLVAYHTYLPSIHVLRIPSLEDPSWRALASIQVLAACMRWHTCQAGLGSATHCSCALDITLEQI